MAKLPSETYKSQYLPCRDLGHTWGYFSWRGNHRTVQCDNCGTMREETLDGNMKVVWRRYKYPKDYHWKDTAWPIKKIRAELKREARKLARWYGPKGTGRLKLVHSNN